MGATLSQLESNVEPGTSSVEPGTSLILLACLAARPGRNLSLFLCMLLMGLINYNTVR